MSDASELNNIFLLFSRYLSIYISIPIGILGLIGNIFNILIFTRPLLVRNPCSIYLLSSSIAHTGAIVFGVIARIFSEGFGIDPASNNLVFCRFRYFILNCSLFLGIWFVVFASVDRYYVSSRNVHRRRLSNLKYAHYLIVFTIVICLISYSHALVLFTIEQLKSGPFCYAQVGIYRVFHDFFYFAIFSFTPPMIMIIVGFATFYNIHQSGVQIRSTTMHSTNPHQLRRKDRQLIKMLLAQLIATVTLITPFAIQKLYLTFRQNTIQSVDQSIIENFIAQILRLFININCSISFFV
ncbi:hypothetical protein I4U23_004639 [Adineta vaga]|nr:hypothetical protein I4U23_004639 [Adineta vaga]